MDKAKAMSKILKLINLSKSSNEHEAAAALRQAKAMMERFEVTEADLESIDITHTVFQGKNYSKYDDMEFRVLGLLSAVFHVSVVYIRGNKAWGVKSRWCLFGRESRIQIVEYFFDRLMSILGEKRKDFLRSLRGRGYSRAQKTSLVTAYWYGWLSGVSENIHLIAMSESEETLIKRYSDGILGDRKRGHLKGKESLPLKNVRRDEALSAYAQGKESGLAVRLSHGVGGESSAPSGHLVAPPLRLTSQ